MFFFFSEFCRISNVRLFCIVGKKKKIVIKCVRWNHGILQINKKKPNKSPKQAGATVASLCWIYFDESPYLQQFSWIRHLLHNGKNDLVLVKCKAHTPIQMRSVGVGATKERPECHCRVACYASSLAVSLLLLLLSVFPGQLGLKWRHDCRVSLREAHIQIEPFARNLFPSKHLSKTMQAILSVIRN